MTDAFPAARFCRHLAAILALLPALALGVQPAVEMEGATPRATATFAIPEVPPWGYASETGEPAGVLVAITDRMAELADVPVSYELRPHKRAIAELKSGEADFVMLFQSPDAEAFGQPVATVLDTRVVLTTRTGHQATSLADLTGKSVGHIEGSFYGDAFATSAQINKVAVRDVERGLAMLERGRLDALVSYDAMLERVFYASDYDATDFSSHIIANGNQGQLYISRHSPLDDYVPLFQKAIRQMQANGEIIELVRSAR